jgi:tetratricopeptide (TPR) repeat protein
VTSRRSAGCSGRWWDHKEDYRAGQVEVQRRGAEAWLRFAEGRKEEALELIRSAAALEDSADKHPVTPGQMAPAHDLLGQMLIELDRPGEALAEFTKVLSAEPNRFGALYGGARGAEAAGRRDRARELYATFVKVAPDSKRREVQKARDFHDGRTP